MEHDSMGCPHDEPAADPWATGGWTRRRFLTGLGMVGVAALGSQLVTTRVAYAAPRAGVSTGLSAGVGAGPAQNTLITIFLRGGADGLRILAPMSAALGLDYLRQVRGPLVPADAQLIALPGTQGWALNRSLAPLYDLLWNTGELSFVPGVSVPGASRSHFQAQQFIEKGGSATSTTGWLDRVLSQLGPGSAFRALADGWDSPASLAGDQRSLTMASLDSFTFPGWDEIRPQSQTAVARLYQGVAGPLAEDVSATLAAVGTAAQISAQRAVRNGAVYPGGDFSDALKDLAAILHAEVGLQVATVDVGGWDTHTDEASQLDTLLSDVAGSLAAFMTDLGPQRRSRVTVVVQTEFGRRVEMNDSAGADHGTGGLIWLLGGGLAGGSGGGAVHGNWRPLLSENDLADGDVPGVNNAFDVLGELVAKRLGVGALTTVFPGHYPWPLGVAVTG